MRKNWRFHPAYFIPAWTLCALYWFSIMPAYAAVRVTPQIIRKRSTK